MSESRKKIAIQGVKGCFHDEAAREYYAGEELDIVPFESFAAQAAAIAADPSLLGIMAIENTIAGSLLQNHELISRHSLRILGEKKKRISHSLAALPGQTVDDIVEVNSHPMALMQCEEFLSGFPHMKAVEKFDTAGSALEIARNQLRGHAAVCSTLAARTYGLEVLREGIETDRHNFTRFLILANPEAENAGEGIGSVDKASIVFTLSHIRGALSKVLTILAFYDLNLTKIQSFPIVGREWEYRFYIDLAFDDYPRYRQALEAVRPLTGDLTIQGEYNSEK